MMEKGYYWVFDESAWRIVRIDQDGEVWIHGMRGSWTIEYFDFIGPKIAPPDFIPSVEAD